MHSLLRKYVLLAILLTFAGVDTYAQTSKEWLDKGWQELLRDNDTTALKYFGEGYLEAVKRDDTEQKALALLYMGFCSYGYSYTKGLSFCNRAMAEFQKLEKNAPAKALEGRSRCLQLLSTIKARQDLYRESIGLSMEAMKGFTPGKDTTGTLGLIYNGIGFAYGRLHMQDSSEYYHKLALEEHLVERNFTYLPTAYLRMAEIERKRNNKEKSMYLYSHAMTLADSTGNRQAQVASLVGMGEWYWTFEKDFRQAELRYLEAENLAINLTDKSFAMKAAQHLLDLYKEHGDLKKALSYQEIVTQIRDSLYSWDKRKEMKSLEIQFDVAEKDRQLMLIKKQKEVSARTNHVLAIGLILIAIVGGAAIHFLRKANKRDKQLLKTKEALVNAIREQKELKEKQLQQDIEFKENQLSALTLQMVQKSELLQELKDKLENDRTLSGDRTLNKLLNKGSVQDREWADFNATFESLNKNFYARLKEAYPEISPNDLKICALIKLNLSIKEMAGILNISPDSVKTARYRLRKKLQLNTEDNLAEFIASL